MKTMQDLCAELDLTVLTDIAGDANSAAHMQVYAVGCAGDTETGIVGFTVTPWFTSRRSLAAYCEAQYDQIIEKGAPEC
jgi:hypothetical protein